MPEHICPHFYTGHGDYPESFWSGTAGEVEPRASGDKWEMRASRYKGGQGSKVKAIRAPVEKSSLGRQNKNTEKKKEMQLHREKYG